jgi:hypothetical protein
MIVETLTYDVVVHHVHHQPLCTSKHDTQDY